MNFISERPPQQKGSEQEQINALRDYLFRMVRSLNDVVGADTTTAVKISYKNGTQVLSTSGGEEADVKDIIKNATELRSLIIKSAENLQDQINHIENRTFYIKYADEFSGSYPETMYNSPKATTIYMGVCVSTSTTAPTNPALYEWSRIKGDGGTGLNSATVMLYKRSATVPAGPVGDMTYTFASGRLDVTEYSQSGHVVQGLPITASGHVAVFSGDIDVSDHTAIVGGWSQYIPETDGRPCWVVQATAISTEATDVIAASEWSEPIKLVEDGSDGVNGTNGVNGENGRDGRDGRDGVDGVNGVDGTNGISSAAVPLYIRSAETPTKPRISMVYTFATGVLDLSLETIGWSQNIPASDGTPCWVIQTTAISAEATDTIQASEWSEPAKLVEDGTNGTDGRNGTDGLNGYNTAIVYLYKRSNTAVTVDWSGQLIYSFQDKALLEEPAGWSGSIPDSGTNGYPCYMTAATAFARGDTDYIPANEWSEPVLLVENGADGQDGHNGTDGVNGYNSAIVYLYKRSATAPTVDWTNQLTYSFTNKALTSVPTGWSDTMPDGDDPCYVTAATAMSRTDTDTIAYNEFSEPKVLAKNGAKGDPGSQGIQGPAGSDGQTSYLHIKYSNDGETFTPNDGEDMGTWIGTYTDFNEADSTTFSDYEWHRFADDTELRALIDAGDNAVMSYVDRQEEHYNSLYVARSEYGTFKENISTQIATEARGVVESYDYGSSIESLQGDIDLIQNYYTSLNGEIRRGIIEDPETHQFVTGIAIAQNLQFSGEVCDASDSNNPGDGYTYYYLNSGQTFGLYTSTGWQFWIGGFKAGWFDSVDGMLHVANLYAEQQVIIGGAWALTTANAGRRMKITYIGS